MSSTTEIEDIKAIIKSVEDLKFKSDIDVIKLISNDIYNRYINIGSKMISSISKFEKKLMIKKQSELPLLSLESIKSNLDLTNTSNSDFINYIVIVTYYLTYYTIVVVLLIIHIKCMKKIISQSLAYLLYYNFDEISMLNLTIILTVLVFNSLLAFFLGYFLFNQELIIALILAINGLFIGGAVLFSGNAGKSYAYPSFLTLGIFIGLIASADYSVWIRLIIMVVILIVFYFFGSFIGNYALIPYKGKLEIRQPRNRRTLEQNPSIQQSQQINPPAQINNI